MELADILRAAVAAGASDVHLVIGRPPLMRLEGRIAEIPGGAAIDAAEAKRLTYSILSAEQRTRFEDRWELDCSFEAPDLARFRVNVLLQRNGVEAVMRVIPSRIPSPEEIGLTPAMVSLADLPRGLVLVTGPTGSGKSTTLAALMEIVNQRHAHHVLTIEDPIEFVHESKKSIFRQREVGQQTRSFAEALKHALRQDPDVILVGELRDLETISLALTAAETGHLCFGTLHTNDAPSTIDRIIDVFPPHQQNQIRVQVSTTLQAVISQILLPRKDGGGRVACREFMTMTPAIANLIREGKSHMIYNAIETGARFGMIPMDKALGERVREGTITLDEALAKAHSQEVVRRFASVGASSAGLR